MSEKIMVNRLSIEKTKESYLDACLELGLDPDQVPHAYITLAATAGRNLIDSFCEENNLEVPEETVDQTLQRMLDAGVIDEDEKEYYREQLNARTLN